MDKQADLVNSPAMPASPLLNKAEDKTRAAVIKTSSMNPYVDVSGLEAQGPVIEKKASRYALDGRYPLDDYAQVKRASAYFDEWHVRMTPEDRHTYAVNMVKRASELGIGVSDVARKYGSETYAPEEQLKIALAARSDLVEGENVGLLSKVASQAFRVDPDVFCELLGQFDKHAGLHYQYDSHVPDPYWSTYGFEKKAEFSEVIGNTHITESTLKELASMGAGPLKGVFEEDLIAEFRKDPVGIFKSLPVDQRKLIANLANDMTSGEMVG